MNYNMQVNNFSKYGYLINIDQIFKRPEKKIFFKVHLPTVLIKLLLN